MKTLFAALATLAILGAGCDRNSRPWGDRRVPDNNNETSQSRGSVFDNQNSANKESGGGVEAKDEAKSQDLDQSEDQSGLSQSEQSGQTSQSGKTSQAVQSLSESDRLDREGRGVANQKKMIKKHKAKSDVSRKDQSSQSVAIPEASPSGEEHTMNQNRDQNQDNSDLIRNDGTLSNEQNSNGRDIASDSEYESANLGSSSSGTTSSSCNNDPNAHAPFLRSDIAYSATRMDCEGDLPMSYSIDQGLPGEARAKVGRLPASEKQSTCANQKTYSHPLFLRSDIAYGVTGEDCYGSELLIK